ncbi:sulfurtransferase [Luteimonas vadosa]|uniref:Sulfurtransferase n=1 Tax=Luteimonas vadosa TaxID=1165507 RepID=A0ABP9DXX6_9GAMM
MSGWSTLVQAEALAPALSSDALVVLDCRHSLGRSDAGLAEFHAGHLPGALHADMDRDLSGPHRPGAGRHPWPDAARFAERLAAWGVTPGHQVIAYDAGDGAFAARLWFLLRAFGHARVAVLDGGWARWQALGLPVETAVRIPTAARYNGTFDATRLLGAGEVEIHVATGGLLVDARARERFRGEVEPIDAKAGHVPGAANRPFADNVRDGRFKPAEELAGEFATLLDGRMATELLAMCGSGVTACHHLLAMEHAGLPGARLFTGSWSGWIEDPSRPIATGDA